MELQDRFAELKAQGIGVAAISYDSQEALAAFAERRGIADAPLLSDADSAVIRAFGIYNHVAEEGLGPNGDDPQVKADVAQYVAVMGARKMIVGTPFPGTFVVDCEARVKARFFEPFYRERNAAANIMLKLGAPLAGVAVSSTETAHLRIAASQSNPNVTPGSRCHLSLEITPKPNIHVYAPGAEQLGYQVIALNIETPELVQILPFDYPPSELHRFESLDEQAPVYQRPFRLTQEIVVGATEDAVAQLAALDSVTLEGRLDYQACDKVCFDPVSVPLSWKLTIAPLDRQRARPE